MQFDDYIEVNQAKVNLLRVLKSGKLYTKSSYSKLILFTFTSKELVTFLLILLEFRLCEIVGSLDD